MMAIMLAAKTLAANKVAAAVMSVLSIIDVSWAVVLIAQVSTDGIGTETVVPAGTTVLVTGVLYVVFRQFSSGELVHRDPQEANQALAKKLGEADVMLGKTAEAMTDMASAMREMIEANTQRDDRLFRFLENRSAAD